MSFLRISKYRQLFALFSLSVIIALPSIAHASPFGAGVYGADVPFGSATSQSLTVTQDDVLYSFWVEATLNGCTEPSPEVLLDGYVFLLPFVAHTGDYTFDPETETFKICEGDTMFLTLGQPYDTEITWFQNGIPIPGENTVTLAVTQTGAYTVQGAPSVCPLFIQPLGLILPVLVEQCATAVRPGLEAFSLQVYPNPTTGVVTLETAGDHLIETVVLTDANGRLVREWKQQGAVRLAVSLQDVPAGPYFMKITSGDRATVRKIVKD